MHEATKACKRLKPEEVKQLRAASEASSNLGGFERNRMV